MAIMTIPTGVSNCTSLSLSMWFQFPSYTPAGGDWLSLIEFGGVPPSQDPSASVTYSWVEITLLPTTDPNYPYPGYTGPVDFVNMESPWNPNDPANTSLNGTYYLSACGFGTNTGSSTTRYILHASSNPGFIGWYNYSRIVGRWSGSGLYLDAQLMGAVQPFALTGDGADDINRTAFNWLTVSGATNISLGRWHHLFLAAQYSSGNTLLNSPDNSPAKTHKMILMVDGAVYAGSDTVTASTGGSTLLDDTVSPHVYVSSGPGAQGFLMQQIHLPHSADANVSSLVTDNYDQPSNKARRYSDVQLWCGTFIDPRISTNFAKFVKITNGIGKPVSPSTAATAFGTQSLLLKGNASTSGFYLNRGTLGTINRIGTISNFTPTPSY